LRVELRPEIAAGVSSPTWLYKMALLGSVAPQNRFHILAGDLKTVLTLM
jgi:hypothetical protein